MELISAPQPAGISAIDLINLSKDIAQLNLGYLGISVAILGVLGGVFIYFNIKPLKDTLDKQEKTTSDLKERADQILDATKEQLERAINVFKNDQGELLAKALDDQLDKTRLETETKLSELENSLLEKVENVSEGKDAKLKEFILSEIANRVGILEKSLLNEIKNMKEDLKKNIGDISKQTNYFKTEMKDVVRDIKELKVYKYAQEGKMGAIIGSIDLLKGAIDEKDWRIDLFLKSLKVNIKGYILEPEYIAQIEEQLARISTEVKYKVLIDEVREEYKTTPVLS